MEEEKKEIDTSGTTYQGDPDIKILNNSSDEDLEKMSGLLPESLRECKECVRLGRECDGSKFQREQAIKRLKKQ